jgi:hypothetical protein
MAAEMNDLEEQLANALSALALEKEQNAKLLRQLAVIKKADKDEEGEWQIVVLGSVSHTVPANPCPCGNDSKEETPYVRCVVENCPHAYHLSCLDPPLATIPKVYKCPDCYANKKDPKLPRCGRCGHVGHPARAFGRDCCPALHSKGL